MSGIRVYIFFLSFVGVNVKEKLIFAYYYYYFKFLFIFRENHKTVGRFFW